jgi:hypothetical protein
MLDALKNFAIATLTAGIDNAATTLNVSTSDAAKLPSAPFNAVVYNFSDDPEVSGDAALEIVRVTSVNLGTGDCAITRAQEGTSAQSHNSAGKTYKLLAGITAASFSNVSRNMPAGPGTQATVTNGVVKTVTIPGGSLAVGDLVRVTVIWSRLTAGGGNVSVQLLFGATTLFNGSMTTGQTSGTLTSEVHVTGASTQKAHTRNVLTTATSFNGTNITNPAEAIAGDIAVVVKTGTITAGDALNGDNIVIEIVKAQSA